MGAGKYRDRVVWLRRAVTKDATTGQDVESFAANGSLWGRIEEDTGRRNRDYGAEQTGADATIRVRNFPTLGALDRLQHGADVWVIEHVRRGEDELVCVAHRFDELNV